MKDTASQLTLTLTLDAEPEPELLPVIAPPKRETPSPASVYIARLAKGSRRSTEQRLRLIVGTILNTDPRLADPVAFPWERFEYAHVVALRAELAERGMAPGSINAVLSSLRGVLKECWRLGLMSAEAHQRARDFEPVKGKRIRRGRALSQDEIDALFHACLADSSPAGYRDVALLSVLYFAALRRSEAVALDVDNFDAATQMIRVLRGKGNKGREVPINEQACEYLSRYIARRTIDTPPLYLRGTRAHSLLPYRLTDQAVRDILLKRCEQAEIDPCAPHDLRRTSITLLLDAGADSLAVSLLVGHSSVNTTKIYWLGHDRAKRKVATMLTVNQ